jgi:predicted RNA-binding protein with RPS1 domain
LVTAEPGKGPVGQVGEERRPFVTREERDRRRRAAIEGLKVGEWREGRVTSTTAFGAFVNLGEVDGLIHISQLGEGGYVERVEDVVTVGQTVRVRIVETEPERGRVSLSMREPGVARPPRAPRVETARPPLSPSTPPPTPAPDAESRDYERRAGGGRRPPAERGTGRRREEERQRGSRRATDDEDNWRDLRGGTARDYAYFYGEDDEEEPAPQSAEELVARFSRREPR